MRPCNVIRGPIRLCVWVFVSIVGSQGGPACAQDPPYRSFTVADGLPSNTVYRVLETSDGYLWFGTDAGASRFDGSHFRNFTTNDGLADNEVLAMFEDSQHRIWFHSLNGRVCYWQNERFHGESEHPEFALVKLVSGLYSVVEAEDGSIWFAGHSGGLFRWKNRSVEAVAPEFTCPGDESASLLRLISVPEQQPWLVTSAGLARITADGIGRFACLATRLEHPDLVEPRGEGLAYIAENAIHALDMRGGSVITHINAGPPVGGYRAPRSSAQGDLWLPGLNGGVLWIQWPGRPEERQRLVLQHVNVLASFDDSDGGRWLTTDGHGVIHIDPWQQQLGVVQISRDQRERGVTSVLATKDHGVLFGTAQGSIYQWQGDRCRQVMPPNHSGSVRDRLRALAADAQGNIWFCSDMHSGALRPGPRTPWPLRHLPIIDLRGRREQVFHGGLKSIVVGPHGELVGSMFGIGIGTDTLGGLRMVFRPELTPAYDRIYAPCVDSAGGLWYETNTTLLRRYHGRTRHFPELSGSFGARITDIAELPGGRMAIATAGNGVVVVDSTGHLVSTITRKNGMPSDQCRSVVVRDGGLVVATDNGVAWITGPMEQPAALAWSALQGSPTVDIQMADKQGDSLYLATPEGLVIIPIHVRPPAVRTPKLCFGSISVNGAALATMDRIHLNEGDRARIGLRPISFIHPARLSFAYSEGNSSNWVALPSADLPLEGLAAGEYDYRFRVHTKGGEWSDAIALQVIVHPPWYWTTGSQVTMFLACLMGTAALVVLFMRRALRRERYERERQLALTEERRRIAADMHDDLGADVSHLLMLVRDTAGSAEVPASIKRNLGSVESHAHTMLRKMDEVIWSLDPADDELRAVLEFLQRYTEGFAAENGLSFRTQPIGQFRDQRMTGQQRRELYLIIKELLNNVRKHTSATTLRYEAKVTEDQVHIQVEDDGEAHKDKAPGRNGHGINNIRQRLEHLRAELRTEALTPVGTRTIITLRRRWIDQF